LTIAQAWLTFNLVVERYSERLDSVFHALSDPTRRGMLAMLADDERTVSELAEPFEMSLAAASKHIQALERAGLLEREVQGRTHVCRLAPDALQDAHDWFRDYERFWSGRLDALERELKKAKRGVKKK
jgi:DNA-binding transcriptional ArsR family regulator